MSRGSFTFKKLFSHYSKIVHLTSKLFILYIFVRTFHQFMKTCFRAYHGENIKQNFLGIISFSEKEKPTNKSEQTKCP